MPTKKAVYIKTYFRSHLILIIITEQCSLNMLIVNLILLDGGASVRSWWIFDSIVLKVLLTMWLASMFFWV